MNKYRILSPESRNSYLQHSINSNLKLAKTSSRGKFATLCNIKHDLKSCICFNFQQMVALFVSCGCSIFFILTNSFLTKLCSCYQILNCPHFCKYFRFYGKLVRLFNPLVFSAISSFCVHSYEGSPNERTSYMVDDENHDDHNCVVAERNFRICF